MDGRAGWLSRWAITTPRRAVAWTAALTLLATPGILRLRLHTDGKALVPAHDPVVLFDAEVRRHHHLRDPILVYFDRDHAGGLFHPPTLARVRALSSSLAQIPGIGAEHVVSLATESRDRLIPGSRASFRPFLDPPPVGPAELAALRRDLDGPAAAILMGTVVAADRSGTAILVGAPGGTTSDRRELCREIEARTRAVTGAPGAAMIVGAPVAESLLGLHLIEDLALLLPLVLGVIAAILGIGCGRVAGVALAYLKVGGCLLFTFGLMGWVGSPVYLTGILLPIILATMALADEIHLLLRYQRALEAPGDRRRAALDTMGQMTTPVVLASASTAVGFLSLLGSGIAPVRFLGLFAGAGILYSMIYSLVLTPAAWMLLPSESLRRRRREQRASGEVSSFLAGLADVLKRRRRLTLAGLALVTAALGLGALRLSIQDGWIDSFAPGTPFRRDTDRVNAKLFGTHQLLAHLELGPRTARTLADPEILAAIGELEAFLRAQPEVGGVVGLPTYLASLAHFWLVPGPGTGSALPASRREAERLLNRFDLSPGEARRRQVVDADLRRTLVTVYLASANFRDTASLQRRVEDFAERHLTPLGLELRFAGDVAVSQAMIPAVIRTQIRALPTAVGGVLLAIGLLYRSLRIASLALLPIVTSALWLSGAMGWLGVPLGVATSMFFVVAVGLGVDSTSIHFLERYRLARRRGLGQPGATAVIEAGPAIVVNTLAVAAGFGLLAVSQVPANARLGLLVAGAVLAGGFLTLVGLGALLQAPSDSFSRRSP